MFFSNLHVETTDYNSTEQNNHFCFHWFQQWSAAEPAKRKKKRQHKLFMQISACVCDVYEVTEVVILPFCLSPCLLCGLNSLLIAARWMAEKLKFCSSILNQNSSIWTEHKTSLYSNFFSFGCLPVASKLVTIDKLVFHIV